MKVRCICGWLLHDENPETCQVFNTYLDEDYYDLLESNPKSIEELVDNMPSSGGFWSCKECGRLLFFKEGKIEIFKLEKEILS